MILLGVPFRGQVINQIDLAATLSLVLGHPIPKNSYGILTMDVLGHLDLEKKLKAAFINAQQLKNVASKSHPNFELGFIVQHFFKDLYCALEQLDWMRLLA